MRAVDRVVVVLLSMVVSGCTIRANLDTGFVQWPPSATTEKRDALAVQRFVDERPPRVYTTGGRGFMTYIPVLPYVAMPFERLDESALKAGVEVGATMPPFEQFTYPVSMARAIAVDLKASGLFEDVVYVGSDSPAAYRYALSGTLRASPLEKDLTSYGLGFVGVLVWLVPIPIGQTWASVTLDLVVTDTVTQERVWQRRLQREYSKWFTFWNSGPTLVYGGVASFDIKQVPYPAGVDRNSLFSWHFEILRQAMQGVPQEIAAALPPDR
ncbi:MAG: hypothetical protein ACRERC_01570 [Candidatus Binatia bacterium]